MTPTHGIAGCSWNPVLTCTFNPVDLAVGQTFTLSFDFISSGAKEILSKTGFLRWKVTIKTSEGRNFAKIS
jgi:hypothetical protein